MPTPMRKTARAALFAVRNAEQKNIDAKFKNRDSNEHEFVQHRDESNTLEKWCADCMIGISNMPLPMWRSKALRRSVEEQESASLSALEVFFLGLVGGIFPGLNGVPLEQQLMFTAIVRMIACGMDANVFEFRIEAMNLARKMGYSSLQQTQTARPGAYITNVILNSKLNHKSGFWRFKLKPKM